MKHNTLKNKMLHTMLTVAFGVFAVSCADNIVEQNKDVDTDVDVSFVVSDVQQEAMAKRAQYADMPMPKAMFAKQLADMQLTFDNLITQQVMVTASSIPNISLVQTTIPMVDTQLPIHTTRGTMVTMQTLQNFSTIGYRGSTKDNISNTAWFYDAETTKEGKLTKPIRWSLAQPWAKFYAVSPRPTTANKLQLSPNNVALPYVTFEVDPNVKNQKDLMVATSDVIHYEKQGVAPTVQLQLNHALTAVRFKVGDNLSVDKYINKIEIENAKGKGTYTLPDNKTTKGTHGTWNNIEGAKTFTLDGIRVSTKADVNHIIIGTNGDNATFFMIPQQLSGIKLKVYFEGDNKPAMVARLKGEWKPGTTVTYAITQKQSTWNYQLDVEDIASEAEYNAGHTNNFKIKSYRKCSDGTQQAVPWRVVGYDDGNGNYNMQNKPSWVTDLSIKEGKGGIDGETGNATITTNIVDLLQKRNDGLKGASVKGNDNSRYDLSTHNYKGEQTNQNTANCYLISSPGYYKLPLVYGNAIKDGKDNKKAYKCEKGNWILDNFTDHLGTAITSPYIYKQEEDVYQQGVSAEVLWADRQNLVANVAIKDNYLVFDVTKEHIQNGNVVVGIKDKEGKFVWSWHIWIAPVNALRTITCTNASNKDYKFTAEPIGLNYTKWQKTIYDETRMVKVKIEQLMGNGERKYGYINIKQKAWEDKEFNATLYQWGRKDAFPYIDYPSTNAAVGKINIEAKDLNITTAIQCPNTFYPTPNADHSDYGMKNLWSATCKEEGANDDKIEKTIYDPSPVGYHVPAANAFTGFTKDKTVGGWNKGYRFVTKNNEKIELFACGFRYNVNTQGIGGAAFRVHEVGYYWTAGKAHKSNGYGVSFYPNGYPNSVATMSSFYGNTILPVAE